MKSTYKLIWSDEALNSLKAIVGYLEENWTEKEIRKFVRLLDKQLERIQGNPLLFPESEHSKGFRKSVLTKQVTIYYRIVKQDVRIISVFDNRQHPGRLQRTK